MKKTIYLLLSISILSCALCGCSEHETPPEATPEATLPVEQAPETTVPSESNPTKEPVEEMPDFIFEDISNLEFYFSSGAGGWRTVLHIQSDGTFEGVHSDSEMGVTGEGFPNGTYYICEFSGAFCEPAKINDYTYSFRLDSLVFNNHDDAEIIDGVRYVNSTPYGVEGGEVFYLYLPGAPLSELPDAYLDWMLRTALDNTASTLPFYGLYNVTEECGFSSYKIMTPAENIAEQIKLAETSGNEIDKLLEDPYLTQTDMNIHSYELYLVWDNALNTIWNILKANLDPETMAQLTEEEIVWITEKEAAMEEAGKECEGGSIYPCIVNGVATEYTRARVYVLAEYAKLIPAE